MVYRRIVNPVSGTAVSLSEFLPSGGTGEVHAVITPPACGGFVEQYSVCRAALEELNREKCMHGLVPLWVRYYLSDTANQAGHLDLHEDHAVFAAGQAPLGGTKLEALAVFAPSGEREHTAPGELTYSHNGCTHIFHSGLTGNGGDVYSQSFDIFSRLHSSLAGKGLDMTRNLLRTWIYVEDIDNRYGEMVRARNDFFDKSGMTSAGRSVASTGIEGTDGTPSTGVYMDAWSVDGLSDGQFVQLRAESHMSHTSRYGVSFERGTCINYGDRKHVIVSGTASIDTEGVVMHPDDVEGQLGRTLENIGAVLGEAGCGTEDLAHLVVYLRDPADYKVVKERLETVMPGVPAVFVKAAVCRREWLVEIEAMAIRKDKT